MLIVCPDGARDAHNDWNEEMPDGVVLTNGQRRSPKSRPCRQLPPRKVFGALVVRRLLLSPRHELVF
jgi:hypothetical protein